MRLLAIDPGSNFGWASFRDKELIHFGDFSRISGDYPNRVDALGETVCGKHDRLVVEDVVKGSHTMKNWEAVWHTVGVQYTATGLAEMWSMEVIPIGQQTLKAYMRKKLGLAGRESVTKKQIIAYVNHKYDLKLLQKDHNIADSICLGECYLETKGS